MAAAVLLSSAGMALAPVTQAAAATQNDRPKVIKAVQHDTSAPLKAMHGTPGTGHAQAKVPGHNQAATTPPSSVISGDPVLQTTPPAAAGPALAGSFEGIGAGIPGYNVTLAPSDVNGAIGPNHYVQIANTSIAVFSRTGAIILNPEPISTLWTGFGGLCETTNGGDPIVLYDRLADRWLVSQLAYAGANGTSVPYENCVAVSTTNDPTGAYFRYAFPRSELPDYAKFSVWPDAYYMTDNDFQNGNTFNGATFAALDRNAMLTGAAATMLVYTLFYASPLPAGFDGLTPPPAGEPGFALALSGSNGLALWRLHADFVTPNNSTLTGPITINVAPFRELCNGFFSCVPQAAPGGYLASLGDRLMYRVAYRNFGDHESLVASHSVDPGAGGNISGGLRWYELRDPAGAPALYQQGTFAPDGNFRWMGSAGMDARGDIAAGYSVSGPSMAPSIAMTGRLAGDPLGTFPQGETSVIQGTGVQQYYLERWGDYTSMAVDPVDDCTFWYTNQYLTTTGTFNWHTRVASFKYPACSLAASSTALTTSPNPSTGGPVTLTATVSGGTTAPTGSVTFQDGNTVLTTAALTNGQATVNIGLQGGTRSLTAAYSGDATYSGSSSSAVAQVVNLPATTTSLTSSAATSYAGNSLTLTATVSGTNPTGTVTLSDGGLTIGTVTLSGGSASLTTGGLAVGAHTITAAYSGDTANAASASAGLSISVAGPAYSLAYSFTGGADSGFPQEGMTQAPDGALYGVTNVQGSGTYGTIFRFAPGGSATTLHTLVPADGGLSRSKLLVGADGALYGTSQTSSANSGTVWRITTQGAFSVLHTFNGSDGRDPAGGLVQDAAGNLYGLTVTGGTLNCGTAYSLSPTGALTTLFSFTCGVDGNGPQGALTFGSDGNLYGVTFKGGADNQGTIFRVTTAGSLTTLYSFTGAGDGALPQAGLLLASDGNFYGTSSAGVTGRGTIFRITPAGAFTTVYSLTPGDGSEPLSALVQDSRGNLFGEALFTNPGSSFNQDGTVYELTSTGTFVRLRAMSFSTGTAPSGGLTIARDGTLYGTNADGGAYGAGALFSFTQPGPPSLSPSTFSNLSEGFNFSLQVATLTGGAAPFTVGIDWGDGTTSAGTVNGTAVNGTHTWAEESPASTPNIVKVTVTDAAGQTATTTDSAAVADAGINASLPTSQTVQEGATWSGTLETFTDVNPGGVVSDYTATIDWLDGTQNTGTISGTGPFNVGGSHTYKNAGNRSAIVTFTDAGGASNYAVIAFKVTDAPLSGSAVVANATEGSAASTTVATFTDANPYAQAGDFTATITWGDGSTSAGTVSGTGTFTVSGGHAYAEAGTYATSVTINDAGGAVLTVSGSAKVADYALTAYGISATVHKAFSGKVATLYDADPSAVSSDFKVTITWGDGTSSSGTVTGGPSPFTISGTHNYKTNGTYTVTITVTDNGGATATATTKLLAH
ncbi:MAG TPA: choice-of-anchor tandem repeat GloVer-containing protein [Candidatus Dormibacteraeota bacterium]|nr:choice-of-anchor tandem repeat GloVer-containing protein [Candidatus Dormibacteraeota bacterium]